MDTNSIWQVSEDVHEPYLWRLGNLALLSGPKNIANSNKAFDIKKPSYSASKIEPNHELANNNEWTTVEIEARQQQFADYAIQIWQK